MTLLCKILPYLSYLNYLDLAIRLYGKDWRKVEDFVKTRSGAQIRSHAQKYFIRI